MLWLIHEAPGFVREPYVEHSAGLWADTQNYDISEEGWNDFVAEMTSGKLGKVSGQTGKCSHIKKTKKSQKAWTEFHKEHQDAQNVFR